ncbi:MAG: metal-dependent hydrolase [Actinobacteria bacterium 13_2_20CM_2_71_6]|nr:MAG: metal-dependent hydrolase [Actinobacteria bacterium 13_2_20CM_2_71_6]
MMGPSHALSGAAAWLAGSLAVEHFAHFHQTPVQLAVGTAMCAGGALLPDLDLSGRVTTDQGGATVAHTFGVVSLFLAECVEKVSLGIYDLTRTRRDPRLRNGHRTFTHTLPFNIGVGFGVFELCWHYGKWAVLGVLFVTFAMALRGLFEKWARKAGWLIVTLVAGAATWGAYEVLPGNRGYPVLGVALGVGGIVHLLGDMITSHGCPILWPIPTGRRMWRNIGVPDAIAVTVGGKVEVIVLRTLFVLVSLAAGAGLFARPVLRRYNIEV